MSIQNHFRDFYDSLTSLECSLVNSANIGFWHFQDLNKIVTVSQSIFKVAKTPSIPLERSSKIIRVQIENSSFD